MKNCNCHYQVPRDGSGQRARYLQALDPSFAPVDGRSMEDMLVFAKRYAAQIRFYDIPESKIEDGLDPEQVSWREFFRRDMAVIAASIAIVDLGQLQRDYRQIREHLELHPDRDIFAALFDPVMGMAAQIDRWYAIALQDNPLHADLDLAINSYLREQISKIIAYEEAYKYIDPKKPLNLDFSAIESAALWGLDASIEPDSTVFEGATLEDKIRYAALFVDDVFNTFYAFMTELVEVKSVAYLQYALEMYPAHQPHMALFIAFLELFRIAQQQMNGVTERMLDFYYREVLRLANKPSIPDRAYVIFELAKDVAAYDIAPGTLLKAGKDAAGKEQLYTTMTDLVVNKAKVKELKTVFIQKVADVSDPAKGTIEAIFARPVANSLDGFGEKIADPSGKWPTFGTGVPVLHEPKNICEKINLVKNQLAPRKDLAQIGFALASPQLLLQGGNRLITWYIESLPDLLPALGKDETAYDLQVWLTGEKGWVRIATMLAEEDIKKLEVAARLGIFDPTLTSNSGYYVDRSNKTLCLYLPVAEQAVVPFDAKLHEGYAYVTDYPIMQVMLGPDLNIAYGDYAGIHLFDQSLAVRVGSINPTRKEIDALSTEDKAIWQQLPRGYHFDGLKTLVLQNDSGLLDANKPFDPYSLYPDKGKSFYIGSAEVFNKPLGKLAIDIKKSLDKEPRASGQTGTLLMSMVNTQNVNEYSVSVLSGRQWVELSDETGNDFSRVELTANILSRPVSDGGESESIVSVALERTPITAVTQWQAQAVKGFIRIDNLIPVVADSGAYLQASQELAPQLQIKEISVSYYSELSELDPNIDQFFHVYPFGVTEVFLEPKAEFKQRNLAFQKNTIESIGIREEFAKLDRAKDYLLVDAQGKLLPQFTYLNPNAVYQSAFPAKSIKGQSEKLQSLGTVQRDWVMNTLIVEASGIKQTLWGGNNQYSGLLQEEGLLFIGIENAQPLSTLALLFQFAEGSAADEDNDPPEIHWSYLTNNEWRPLKGEDLISDGTYGFQTTGIVKLAIPADSTDQNTIITSGLCWFCASVSEHSERIPMLVNVVAQAVEAKFQDNGNDQAHFDNALPAESINKLAVAVAQIGKVEQPFASFDGKHREVGKEYYTRVSERLRHKNRAITPWDYELLVLERFPSIYKVKCITHSDPNCLCRTSTATGTRTGDSKSTCCGPQIAPGHVLIVPIANLKNRNAVNPLQPKTSRRTLLEIQDYLSKRTSPFVRVHARNPVYEQVLVFFRVQFIAGADKGYYLQKLNDEIVHYLTPWAYDENADVSFAQKIYASAVINFIEERPYVDFITDFLMFVCRDECCTEELNADTSVDAPATAEDSGDKVMQIASCCDMEALLAENRNFIGEIVIEPSTPRSLLVSAPKHIIIPYEAPLEVSPCEQRKLAKMKPAEAIEIAEKPMAVAAETNIKTAQPAVSIAKPEVTISAKTTRPARTSRTAKETKKP